MLYQYKNFRSKEAIRQNISKESSELFKIMILLIIINLILVSLYFSEKTTYDSKKLNEVSSYNLSSSDEQILHDEENKNSKIIEIMNDKELCSLCSSIDCNNGEMQLECSSSNIDNLYGKIKNHNSIKKCDMEGDSSKFILKLVIN